MRIINFSDIVEENGKTIRENNRQRRHKYPIGTLVEFEVDEYHGGNAHIKGTVRAYVCYHNQDCDGSPLYDMSMWDPTKWSGIYGSSLSPENYASLRRYAKMFDQRRVAYEHLFQIWFTCYGEDSLKPV